MNQKNERGFSFLIIIVLILAVSAAVAGAYYLGTRNSNSLPQNLNLSPAGSNLATTSPTLSQTPQANSNPDLQWKKTAFMGAYSFEYPFGWHVDNRWPTENGGPILVAINPEPIDGGPRDGPIAKITIADWNGLQNPDQKLIDLKNGLNKYLKPGFKVETVSSSVGNIYHYDGRMIGPMMEDTPNEGYIFSVSNANLNDNLNKHILQIESINNSVSTEILSHIALSFKSVIH